MFEKKMLRAAALAAAINNPVHSGVDELVPSGTDVTPAIEMSDHNNFNTIITPPTEQDKKYKDTVKRFCVKTFSGKDPGQVTWTDPDCAAWAGE